MSTAIETRPWGAFEVLLDAADCKVKRITVRPGKRLSLQSHERRAEHWVCLSAGAGAVARVDNTIIPLRENTTIFIPHRTLHRLDNSEGRGNLVIIEVQTGDYFGEDDIVRYEDDFGRS